MKKVICADAEKYIHEHFMSAGVKIPSVFTSLPDAEETGMAMGYWEVWFRTNVRLICQNLAPEGYAIFYQTDRKYKGHLLSKSEMVISAATAAGCKTIFHRIALTTKVGAKCPFRPGFTHLIAVSKEGTVGTIQLPETFEAGRKVYDNATGLEACRVAFEFLAHHDIREVWDFYCGRGSIQFVGERKFGMKVHSIDIDNRQCAQAERFINALDELNFTEWQKH